MAQQLDLFGAMLTQQVEKPTQVVVEEIVEPITVEPVAANFSISETKVEEKIVIEKVETVYDAVKRKRGRPRKNPAFVAVKVKLKRGRKSLTETYIDTDFNDVPTDEELNKKQYYSISQVAKWFNITNSQLRFWENEFDILKPKKNKKGNRLFRPEDVKNLKHIYFLLRKKKLSVQGAKDYLKANVHKTDSTIQLQQSLQNFRSFLLEIRASL